MNSEQMGDRAEHIDEECKLGRQCCSRRAVVLQFGDAETWESARALVGRCIAQRFSGGGLTQVPGERADARTPGYEAGSGRPVYRAAIHRRGFAASTR